MSSPSRRSTAWLRALADQAGATAIEYGLIATLIAVAIIGAVTGVATSLKTTFNNIGTAVH